MSVVPYQASGSACIPACLSSDPSAFLFVRAQNIAAQARRKPITAQAARAWLCLASRRAASLGLAPLAGRISALERAIL